MIAHGFNYPIPIGGVPNIDGPQLTAGTWTDKVVENRQPRVHNHYFKDVTKLQYIDVYRVLGLFSVTDPSIAHAVKKLLVAGGRGAGKSIDKDIQEAIDVMEFLGITFY